MRTLLLMRHAKSAWDSGVDDHERPLNARGLRAATTMNEWLERHDQVPELLLSSTALRARDTAIRVSAGWPAPVREERAIYGGTAEELLAVVAQAPARVSRLMLVGHEPGLPGLARLLGGGMVKFPTAAVARLDLDIDGWTAIAPACGRLMWLIIPRLLGAAANP